MRYRLECPANRYVFKSRLNCSESTAGSLRQSGSDFQTTEKARVPKMPRLSHGTNSWWRDLFQQSAIVHLQDMTESSQSSVFDNNFQFLQCCLPHFGLGLSKRCPISVAEIRDVLISSFFFCVTDRRPQFRAVQHCWQFQRFVYILTVNAKLMCLFFHTGFNLPNTLVVLLILNVNVNVNRGFI